MLEISPPNPPLPTLVALFYSSNSGKCPQLFVKLCIAVVAELLISLETNSDTVCRVIGSRML